MWRSRGAPAPSPDGTPRGGWARLCSPRAPAHRRGPSLADGTPGGEPCPSPFGLNKLRWHRVPTREPEPPKPRAAFRLGGRLPPRRPLSGDSRRHHTQPRGDGEPRLRAQEARTETDRREAALSPGSEGLRELGGAPAPASAACRLRDGTPPPAGGAGRPPRDTQCLGDPRGRRADEQRAQALGRCSRGWRLGARGRPAGTDTRQVGAWPVQVQAVPSEAATSPGALSSPGGGRSRKTPPATKTPGPLTLPAGTATGKCSGRTESSPSDS